MDDHLYMPAHNAYIEVDSRRFTRCIEFISHAGAVNAARPVSRRGGRRAAGFEPTAAASPNVPTGPATTIRFESDETDTPSCCGTSCTLCFDFFMLGLNSAQSSEPS